MASSTSDMDVDAAAVEAETSLFESFASLPFAAGAQLHRDPHDNARLTLRVTTSQRDLVANKARRSVATMTVDKAGPTRTAGAGRSASKFGKMFRHWPRVPVVTLNPFLLLEETYSETLFGNELPQQQSLTARPIAKCL